MHISRLELKNWKNFSSIDVRLANKTIIVGPNASGKSNFLDSIRFLRDVVRQGGGLQQAVNIRGGVSNIRSQSAKKDPRIKLAVEISEGSDLKWRYELEFTQTGGGVRQTYAIIKHESLTGYESGEKSYFTFTPSQSNKVLEQYTSLERPDVNQQFQVFIDFLKDVQYLHILPQLVRDPNSFIMTNNVEDFFGRDFIKHVASTPKATSELYLNRIASFLRVAVPNFQEIHIEKDKFEEPHLAVKFKTWRGRGVNQNESHLSDGTLRLVGLLWSLQYGSKPVLLEEPELSLHPEIVRRLYEIISSLQKNKRRSRQVILTTHSHDLLSNQAIQPDEVILLESQEGHTTARNIDSIKSLNALIESGFNIAEVVLPKAAPKNIADLDKQLELNL